MPILNKMPRDLRAVYFCPVCCTAYESFSEATACALTVKPLPFSVGDIVTTNHAAYGWHDGLDHWVKPYKAGRAADPHGVRRFYYVVTAIGTYNEVEGRRPFHDAHPNGHDPVFWVRTLAMRESYAGGWTTQDTHVPMSRVIDPPALVVEESRALIGWREKHLL